MCADSVDSVVVVRRLCTPAFAGISVTRHTVRILPAKNIVTTVTLGSTPATGGALGPALATIAEQPRGAREREQER